MLGKQLLNYKIDRLIAEGGMGAVYLGRHVNTDSLVAIKVLPFAASRKESERERFRLEANILSSLNHPGIVRFLNFHEDADGLYIFMEYAGGVTLAEHVAHRSGPVAEPTAKAIMISCLEACRYAHGVGIIHRDIKPSNIMISDDLSIKVLDFGVAKLLETTLDPRLTKSGARLGTPMYMSPEQIKGATLDPRTDIYSFGVLLHHLLTGKPPYEVSSTSEFELQVKIVQEPLPRARDFYPHVSDHMQRIIDRATAKNPDLRYPNCDEFIRALMEEEDKGTVTLPPKAGLLGKALGFMSRRFKWVAAASLIVIAATIGIGVWIHKVHVRKHDAHYQRGMEYVETAQYDSASAQFSLALKQLETDSAEREFKKVSTLIGALDNFYAAKYRKAYTQFEEAAELGVADAYYYLGELQFNGLGTKMDQVEGKKNTEKAIEMGFGMAYWRMGVIYSQGLAGDSVNEKKANEYYFKAIAPLKKLAEAGDPEAQANLGNMYGSGSGLEKNEDLEESWMLKAAETGYAFAQTSLGAFYITNEKFRNGAKAENWLGKAAKQGDARGQYYLGMLYESDLLGSPNYSKAKEQYELASAQDYAPAHTALGDLYYLGRGSIPEDNEKARTLYIRAAEENDPTALYRLGDIYYNGYGVYKDYSKALEYFELAQKNGMLQSYFRLGIMYELGQGTPRNLDRAAAYYLIAYLLGNEDALFRSGNMYYNLRTYSGYQTALGYYKILAEQSTPNKVAVSMLGVMYYEGQGTSKNCSEAAHWFRKAYELGVSEARSMIYLAEYVCED